MKKLIVIFTILFAAPLSAQITLEQTYNNKDHAFGLLQVDSNEYLYAYYNSSFDTLTLYNLDHSLYQSIHISVVESGKKYYIENISRRLFNLDDKIEFAITKSGGFGILKILQEDGTELFSCDTCDFHNSMNYIGTEAIGTSSPSIVNTSSGAKMMVFRFSTYTTEVYSLPGKLPTSNTKLSVTDAPTIISSSSPSTSAYPNPSNGKIRVAYSLPEGVSFGELVITATDGREMKRYRVGNMFNDILIEKSELPSGAYFYKLITERGESEARKFVIAN